MSKLMIALIGTAFAATVAGQTPAPAPAKPAPATIENPQDAAAARRAASPETVKKTTEDKGHTQRAGEASEKAAAKKDTPKPLPDTASQREAVSKTTADKGHTQRAGEASEKAKTDKTPPPPRPKAQAGTPELLKVVP